MLKAYSKIKLKQKKYIAACYWTIQTVVTVGYGDIHPTTIEERLFI